MKTKVKALAAVLPLLAAVQANAAINDDGGASLGSGSGAGELFLSVIDRGGSSPESYVRDLGITTGAFLANPTSFLNTSFSADSNLQSLLTNQQANGGTIHWNLAGESNQVSPVFNVGALTTAPTQLTTSNTPQGQFGLAPAFTKLADYTKAVNQAADPNNMTNYAANNSVLVASSNTGAYYDGVNWGAKWLDPTNTEGASGQSLGFYFVGLDPNTGNTMINTFSGQWTLASNGTLSYAASAPAPVPLPPAVWLLGSALVGLVGVGRRRTGTAV